MPTYRTSVAGGTAAANTNVTAILTPVIGDLFVVFALETGTSNTASSVTDNNANEGEVGYTKVASVTYSGGVLSAWLRDYMMHNTASTTVTYDPASTTNTGAQLVVVAITGAFASGIPGIRQFATNSGSPGAAATTFSSSAVSANMTLVALGNGTNPPGLTAPTGWTNRQNVGQTTPLGEIVATRDSGFAATSIQWGTNPATDWGMISLELTNTGHNSVYQDLSGLQALTQHSKPGLNMSSYQMIFPQRKRNHSMAVIEVLVDTAVTVPVFLRGFGTDAGVAGIPSSSIVVSLKKNGGAYATISPTITDRGGGTYDIALTSSHTDQLGLGMLRVSVTPTAGVENVVTNDEIMLDVVAFNKQNSYDLGLKSIELVSGLVVADGGNTANTFKTNLSASETDHYRRTFVVFITGTLTGQVAMADTFNPGTQFIGFGANGFTATPSNGDEFLVINR